MYQIGITHSFKIWQNPPIKPIGPVLLREKIYDCHLNDFSFY